MLCYKDMCFCPFYEDCRGGESCDRALTMDVMEDAECRDLLISRFAAKPECFLERVYCEREDQIEDGEETSEERGEA